MLVAVEPRYVSSMRDVLRDYFLMRISYGISDDLLSDEVMHSIKLLNIEALTEFTDLLIVNKGVTFNFNLPDTVEYTSEIAELSQSANVKNLRLWYSSFYARISDILQTKASNLKPLSSLLHSLPVWLKKGVISDRIDRDRIVDIFMAIDGVEVILDSDAVKKSLEVAVLFNKRCIVKNTLTKVGASNETLAGLGFGFSKGRQVQDKLPGCLSVKPQIGKSEPDPFLFKIFDKNLNLSPVDIVRLTYISTSYPLDIIYRQYILWGGVDQSSSNLAKAFTRSCTNISTIIKSYLLSREYNRFLDDGLEGTDFAIIRSLSFSQLNDVVSQLLMSKSVSVRMDLPDESALKNKQIQNYSLQPQNVHYLAWNESLVTYYSDVLFSKSSRSYAEKQELCCKPSWFKEGLVSGSLDRELVAKKLTGLKLTSLRIDVVELRKAFAAALEQKRIESLSVLFSYKGANSAMLREIGIGPDRFAVKSRQRCFLGNARSQLEREVLGIDEELNLFKMFTVSKNLSPVDAIQYAYVATKYNLATLYYYYKEWAMEEADINGYESLSLFNDNNQILLDILKQEKMGESFS